MAKSDVLSPVRSLENAIDQYVSHELRSHIIRTGHDLFGNFDNPELMLKRFVHTYRYRLIGREICS